ncbi:carbohydrate ABC transporter permease, partial [Streptococcus suis]|nr:carbohydrate ABC transporter permease [Streptococcus suis]
MNTQKQKNWWVYLVLFSGILFMFIPLLVTIISSFKPTKAIT